MLGSREDSAEAATMARGVNVGHYPTAPHDVAVDLLSRYDAIRWANWAQPYTYSGETLLERRDSPFFGGGAWSAFDGVPLANIVDAVLEVGSQVNYFNLPYALSPDSVERAFAEVDRLNDNQTYVALGMEMWNAAGAYRPQNEYLKRVVGSDGYWASQRGAAARIAELARRTGRKFVLEAQAGNIEVARYALEQMHVGKHLSALAIAPYVGRQWFVDQWLREQGLPASAENIYAAAVADYQIHLQPSIVAHAELAQKHGLPLVWYEFNHHLTGNNDAIRTIVQQRRLVDLLDDVLRFGEKCGVKAAFMYRLYHAADAGQHWRMFTASGSGVQREPLADLV